ncbi:MAG TPA: PEP-CTERM sorting domain-containing protein [Terriglobales bacterium]|nr:PEP-CTERM sorting domain-containing protein [Terriglobales bacterium]
MRNHRPKGSQGPRYFILVLFLLILPALAESYWAVQLLWPQPLASARAIGRWLTSSRLRTPKIPSSQFLKKITDVPRTVVQKAPATVEQPGPVIYPYSVVPGGVRSQQGLRLAIANDAVVARHYSDFRVDQARVVHLQADVLAYVSFRLKDGVYWTRRPLLLKRGEAVLTDGVNVARTRCANRVSLAPRMPHAPNEPPPQALDIAGVPSSEFPQFPDPPLPILIPDLARTGPTLPFPSVSPPGAGGTPPIAPFFVPVGGGGGKGPGNVAPLSTAPVPEPGTIALLATGSAIAGWWSRRSRRR